MIELITKSDMQKYSSPPICFVPFQKLTKQIAIFPMSKTLPKTMEDVLPLLNITPAKLFTAKRTQITLVKVLGEYLSLNICLIPTT